MMWRCRKSVYSLQTCLGCASVWAANPGDNRIQCCRLDWIALRFGLRMLETIQLKTTLIVFKKICYRRSSKFIRRYHGEARRLKENAEDEAKDDTTFTVRIAHTQHRFPGRLLN